MLYRYVNGRTDLLNKRGKRELRAVMPGSNCVSILVQWHLFSISLLGQELLYVHSLLVSKLEY